jgi:hypothetical protein
MTPAEREAIYDAEIAPALAALSKRCEECGMSIVAEVEWDGSQAAGGLTVALAEGSSFAIRLIKLASDVRGNVDSMFIALRKANVPALKGSLFMRILDRQHKL